MKTLLYLFLLLLPLQGLSQWSKISSLALYGGSVQDLLLHKDAVFAVDQFIYRSFDNAGSWERLDNIPAGYKLMANEKLLVAYPGYLNQTTLYASDDKGATWRTFTLPVNNSAADMKSANGHFYLNSWSLNGADSTLIYKANDSLTKWELISRIPGHKYMQAKHDKLYFFNNDSLFESSDGITLSYLPVQIPGYRFNSSTTFITSDYVLTFRGDSVYRAPLSGGIMSAKVSLTYFYVLYATVELFEFGDTLFVGFFSGQHGYTFISTDQGATWFRREHLPPGGLKPQWVVAAVKLSDNSILASLDYEGLYQSSDLFESMTEKNNTSFPRNFQSVTYQSGFGLIYSQSKKYYYSADGANWSNSNTGLPKGFDTSLAMLGSTAEHLYILSSPTALFTSADGGANWKKVKLEFNTLPDYISSDSQYAYITTGNKLHRISAGTVVETLNIPFKGKIHKHASKLYLYELFQLASSSDSGKTWETDTTGLGGSPSILKMFTGHNNELYLMAGSAAKIYFYVRSGNSWSRFDPLTSFGFNAFGTVSVSRCGDHYILSQAWGKIYKSSDLYYWLPVQKPATANLVLQVSANKLLLYNSDEVYLMDAASLSSGKVLESKGKFLAYPNPAAISQTLRLELREKACANIQLFSMDGKMLRDIRQDLLKGVNEIDVDLSELPAGLYFYKLNAGEFSATERIVIVR